MKILREALPSVRRIAVFHVPGHAPSVLVLPDLDRAAKARIPASYNGSEFALSGGLISYAVSFVDNFRRPRGGLGLAIPQSILLRADRVIERRLAARRSRIPHRYPSNKRRGRGE